VVISQPLVCSASCYYWTGPMSNLVDWVSTSCRQGFIVTAASKSGERLQKNFKYRLRMHLLLSGCIGLFGFEFISYSKG
jgi:hypothetical protein